MGCELAEADLSNADLSSCKNLIVDQLLTAASLFQTRVPEELSQDLMERLEELYRVDQGTIDPEAKGSTQNLVIVGEIEWTTEVE